MQIIYLGEKSMNDDYDKKIADIALDGIEEEITELESWSVHNLDKALDEIIEFKEALEKLRKAINE